MTALLRWLSGTADKLTSRKFIVMVFVIISTGMIMLRALAIVSTQTVVICWFGLVAAVVLSFYAGNIVEHALPVIHAWLERRGGSK